MPECLMGKKIIFFEKKCVFRIDFQYSLWPKEDEVMMSLV